VDRGPATALSLRRSRAMTAEGRGGEGRGGKRRGREAREGKEREGEVKEGERREGKGEEGKEGGREWPDSSNTMQLPGDGT